MKFVGRSSDADLTSAASSAIVMGSASMLANAANKLAVKQRNLVDILAKKNATLLRPAKKTILARIRCSLPASAKI